MKKGTKIGWALIALSIVLSVWVIISQSTSAVNSAAENAGFDLDDATDTILLSYSGTASSLKGGGSDYDNGDIPASVTTIGNNFLANNGNVTSVSLPSSVTTLQPGAFSGSSVETVTMAGVTSIPSQAFYDSYLLDSLTIPNTVTAIGSQAFYDTMLSSITIPSSVSNISLGAAENRAFNGATELTAINVASGGHFYMSNGGCLYSVTGNLLAVPEGYPSATLSLPSTTTGISDYALDGATNVRTVDIPAGVTSLGSDAFTNSSVEKITVRNRSLTFPSTIGLAADSTIEGYSGSTAQTFAENNGYKFIPLDGSNTVDPNNGNNNNNNNNNGGNTDPNNNNNNNNNGGNNNNNGGNNNGGNNGGNTNGGNTNGGNTNGGNTNGGNTNGGTTNGGTTNGGTNGANTNPANRPGSNTGSTGTTHTADNTPKTADGDLDPRLAIALAVFAGGLAMIILSRRQRAVLVRNAGNSKLDD